MSDVLINSFSVQPAFSYSNGTVDSAFASNLGTGPNGTVYTVCPDPTDGMLIGGSFTSWNGTALNYLVRLNENGTRDTAFQANLGTGPSSTVRCIRYSSSLDKFYVVGSFTSWNGTNVNRIVRLNRDGTRDTAFQTNVGTGANGGAFTLSEQPNDSKVVVGGQFGSWNGVIVNRIVRLNSDGTRDTAFTTNVNGGSGGGVVNQVNVASDGKIVIVGTFTSFSSGASAAGKVVRLNSDGSPDTAFNTNLGTGAYSLGVYSAGLRPDGKIVLSLYNSGWNNNGAIPNPVCLNSDGTLDSAFMSNVGTGLPGTPVDTKMLAQQDNKVLIGGAAGNTYNGVAVGPLIRINSDGTLDTSFTSPYTTDTGAGEIRTDAKNRILVVGSVTPGRLI